MQELGAKMTLDANGYISAMMKNIEYTSNFRKTVEDAKRSIYSIQQARAQTKIEVDAKKALENISQTKKQINEIKKNIAIVIAAKETASESINRIKGHVRTLTSRPFNVVIKAKDEVSSIIRSITDKIFSLKVLAAGIVLGGTAKLAFDNTIGAGARLEQEQVSMKHFIGNNNKSAKPEEIQKMTDDFIGQLRKNANETPFGTNEVLSAGRRSINIMGGDIGKSMGLVNLAENMASLNPGKSVMDAMEALADLKTGEFERMKEFGFKFSAEEFKKLAGKGKNDDLTDSEMSNAYDLLVKNKLNPVFDGGSEKLSKTAAGQWSTTTGNIESIFSDLGKTFLPAINKVLTPVNTALDRIGNSKAFANLQKDLMSFADEAGNKAVNFLNDLANNPKKIEEYKNKFKDFIKGIKEFKDAMVELGHVGKTVYEALKPLLEFIVAHPKLLEGFLAFKIGGSLFKGGLKTFKDIKGIIKEFPKLDTALKGMIKGGGGGLKGTLKLPFTALKDGFKGAKDIGKWVPDLFKITGKNIKGTFVDGSKAVKNFFGLFPKGAKNASKAFKTLRGTFKGATIVKDLKNAFKGIKNLGIGKDFSKTLREAFGPAKKVFSSLGKVIKKFGKNGLEHLKPLFNLIATNPMVRIFLIVITVLGILYTAWKEDWGGIQEKTKFAVDVIEKALGGVNDIIDEVKKEFNEFVDDMGKAYQRLKDFFKDPLHFKGDIEVKGAPKPGGGPQGLARDSWNIQEKALGTSYFSGGLTWVGEVGPELIELPKGAKVHNNRESIDLLKPKKDKNDDFSKTGKDIPLSLAAGMKKTTPNLLDQMTDTTSALIQNFGSGITENKKYPVKSTNDLTNNVKDVFVILGKDSNPLGQNVSLGLAQGIQDSSSNVTAMAKTLTDKVIETFKTGFDIHSPSRVMYSIGTHVMEGFLNGLDSKNLKAFAEKHIKTITGVFGAAVNIPGGVTEWLIAALQATGTPLSWLPGLQKLVMAESGGDPGNWNPQGVGGEHATGLLQTLPSTFQEFMQQGMNNILNPVDNAAAAINYIKSRYGDVYNTPLFRGGPYVGYATGTEYATPGYHWVGEKGPELMKFNGGEQVVNNKDSMSLGGNITIEKLADTLVVREDADIDRIVEKLVKKLDKVAYNMA